jgi:TolB-like protein/class 3 adenylate cyclase/Flp pilus assembly protein TadD
MEGNPRPTESSSEVKFEIGHVLFIDIVGYSKLLINEQSEQIQKLKEIVRGTEQFGLAEAKGKLLRLPTGDGGALVFRSSPEAPVLCAMEISKALKSHPEIHVRMGIHSGPVNEITDLNEQANIAGAGINIAQRVMDCADAGHILLSKRVAGDLEHYPQWRSRLHDLGECEVKHGVRVSVVNLYTDELGNPAVPEKFKTLQQTASPAPARRGPSLIALGIFLLLLTALAIPLLIFAPALLKSLSRRPAPGNSSSPAAVATIAEKSIAVLPFENLSDDKSNAYFADGIQDEILTKLASIADLKVISRTSTAKYKSKPEDLKTVSQQLGVANVVEGTVQRAADKVRVNVQLIDARADAHLWAKSFDRDVKDVFAVESEVSQEIADALQAKLSPNESNALATVPTKDPEAYDLFLKGEYEEREAENSLKAEPFDRAAIFYQQALDRDPNFALAAARLAESRILRHWFVTRHAENDPALVEIKSLVDRALTLAPNLAEAHIALGSFYYYVKHQYEDALKEFGRALEVQPNNIRAFELSAYVYRRQGRWKLSLDQLAKCEERDPQDASLAGNIASSYAALRMWREAKRASSHSLVLDPHNLIGIRVLILSCLNGQGDFNEVKRLLFAGQRATNFITLDISATEAYVHVLDRDFAGARKTCETVVTNPEENLSRLMALVVIHLLANDAASATDEIDKARGFVEAQLRARPNETSLIQLAWINLALRNNTEALRLATQAAQAAPVEKDALLGAAILTGLAQIQARAGEPAAAVNTLQRLLAMPAGFCVSIAQLKIDPVWDPIRNDPGFQQLLAGKELIGPNK